MKPRFERKKTALCVAGMLFTAVIHWQMDTASPAVSDRALSLPDPGRAKLLSLGFEPVLADFYWIHALSAVGSSLASVEERDAVGDLVELVTTLDPWVDHPYRFGALWLVESPEEVERGNALLRRGISYHPTDWRNRFYLGYNHFFYLGNNNAAIEALDPAITMEGSPGYLGALVTRLRAEGGSLEAAARFLVELARTTQDPYLRAGYEKTLDEIETERRARWLDEQRLTFWERHGRDVQEVAELHRGAQRIVDGIPPAHPHLQGFDWVIDEESGEIVSSFYGNRYRLHLQQGDHRRIGKIKGESGTSEPRRPWREERA